MFHVESFERNDRLIVLEICASVIIVELQIMRGTIWHPTKKISRSFARVPAIKFYFLHDIAVIMERRQCELLALLAFSF